MPDMSADPVVRLASRLRHRAVGDEGVLVQIENGRVLVVNEVGLHVVQQLGLGSRTLEQLVESVVDEFEVDSEQARTDVTAFLEQLRAEAALEEGAIAGAGGGAE
jgi:hypothetical protein